MQPSQGQFFNPKISLLTYLQHQINFFINDIKHRPSTCNSGARLCIFKFLLQNAEAVATSFGSLQLPGVQSAPPPRDKPRQASAAGRSADQPWPQASWSRPPRSSSAPPDSRFAGKRVPLFTIRMLGPAVQPSPPKSPRTPISSHTNLNNPTLVSNATRVLDFSTQPSPDHLSIDAEIVNPANNCDSTPNIPESPVLWGDRSSDDDMVHDGTAVRSHAGIPSHQNSFGALSLGVLTTSTSIITPTSTSTATTSTTSTSSTASTTNTTSSTLTNTLPMDGRRR